jgi:tetratricopeptide (TPR) repeat protein
MYYRPVVLLVLAASAVSLSFATSSSGAGSSIHTTIRAEDPLKNPAFVHFYNLEYDQALAAFQRQAECNPDDPLVYNDIAETILYREMFRDGALESELVTGTNPFLRRPKMEISDENKQEFNGSINRSIELSRARLEKNPKDIGALYALVVAHGLRANYLFLVEKAWLDSLHEATEARKADDKILALDPGFVDAHLASGMSEYIVSCLPMYLRILGKIRGFHGDKEDGIRQLEWVAKAGTMDRYDAQVLLAAIYRREHRPKQAIALLKGLVETFPRNYLLRFEQVQMYSDLGDKQSALRVLAQIESLRSSGAPGYANLPRERIEYAKGNLLFWYGDLDSALADLKKVTQKADELDLNTAVMAWLRLGQVYDLKGQHAEAIQAYRKTLNTAPRSAPALEAEGYISAPYRRKPATG